MNLFFKKNNSNMKILHILLISILFSCSDTNPEASKQVKIETFVAAKNLVPGLWIASENIGQGIYLYYALEFKENGILYFSQGADLAQAKELLSKYQIKGNWKLADDPKYLSLLIDEKTFIVLFDLESVGVDGLRIEIRPNELIMGRNSDIDDKTREQMGLFSFGGKIFHKQ
jgi:hypothetical protein